MNAGRELPRILLVEPQFVLRRTIVAVGRELGIGDFQEATSVEAAQPIMTTRPFDGLVVDIGAGPGSIVLLGRLRAGAYASSARIPVVGLAGAADCEPGGRLAFLGLLCTLCRPFKVADLIHVLRSISREPEALLAAATSPRARPQAERTPC